MSDENEKGPNEAARRLQKLMEQSSVNTRFRAMTRTQELKQLWSSAQELTLKLAPNADRVDVEELFQGVLDPLFQMLDSDAQVIALLDMRMQKLEAEFLKALTEYAQVLSQSSRLVERVAELERRLADNR